jgi:hypothetical protein
VKDLFRSIISGVMSSLLMAIILTAAGSSPLHTLVGALIAFAVIAIGFELLQQPAVRRWFVPAPVIGPEPERPECMEARRRASALGREMSGWWKDYQATGLPDRSLNIPETAIDEYRTRYRTRVMLVLRDLVKCGYADPNDSADIDFFDSAGKLDSILEKLKNPAQVSKP